MRLTRGCRAGGGVACSSLEYGGIRAATKRTPAPHGRLLLPTSPPPPHLVLLVHLRSTRLSSPALISRYTLPQEHRRSPAVPSCRFLRILHRLRADNTGDDDDDVPHFSPKDTASPPYVWQRDREDGQKKGAENRGVKEENHVYFSRMTAPRIHLSPVSLSPRICGYYSPVCRAG